MGENFQTLAIRSPYSHFCLWEPQAMPYRHAALSLSLAFNFKLQQPFVLLKGFLDLWWISFTVMFVSEIPVPTPCDRTLKGAWQTLADKH